MVAFIETIIGIFCEKIIGKEEFLCLINQTANIAHKPKTKLNCNKSWFKKKSYWTWQWNTENTNFFMFLQFNLLLNANTDDIFQNLYSCVESDSFVKPFINTRKS